ERARERRTWAVSCSLALSLPRLCSPMHFDLVDRVLEQSPDRIVTLKHVSAAEEYLQDHFPTFPVLPGVMMLEAMVQAGRRMLEKRAGKPLGLRKGRALQDRRVRQPGGNPRR